MIEIMDTTLRDGEQTSGVSFAAHEKLSIAQVLLSELKVDRLEIASARVSEGEFEAVKRVARWAERSGYLDKLEVLGFVDGEVSINWIESAGCRVINLLCKGSYKHVTCPPDEGKSLSGGLVEWHTRLSGVCLPVYGCLEGRAGLPFHAARYVGRLEPDADFPLLPEDVGALSGPAFRFPCA